MDTDINLTQSAGSRVDWVARWILPPHSGPFNPRVLGSILRCMMQAEGISSTPTEQPGDLYNSMHRAYYAPCVFQTRFKGFEGFLVHRWNVAGDSVDGASRPLKSSAEKIERAGMQLHMKHIMWLIHMGFYIPASDSNGDDGIFFP